MQLDLALAHLNIELLLSDELKFDCVARLDIAGCESTQIHQNVILENQLYKMRGTLINNVLMLPCQIVFDLLHCEVRNKFDHK